MLLRIPDLEVADRVFPELLFRYASPWLTGVILAGATAAAMSTLDSILHANMTVLTRDVYQRYVRTDASQAHYVWVGRAIVAALLVIGYILSITSSGYLVTLVSVSGSGALQLAPGICGVCFPGWRLLTRAGVLSGLAVGARDAVLGGWCCRRIRSASTEASGPLAANTLVTVVVSRHTPPPSPETVWRIHGEIERFIYGSEKKKQSLTLRRFVG